MKTSNKGIDFIKSFESFSPITYICSAGVPTIGYGHAIRSGEHFEGISKCQAEEILVQDLYLAEKSVSRNITAPLEQNQFDALVSFAFNLGLGAFQRSTLRQALLRGDKKAAMESLVKYCRAGGKILRGLQTRRLDEKALFESK